MKLDKIILLIVQYPVIKEDYYCLIQQSPSLKGWSIKQFSSYVRQVVIVLRYYLPDQHKYTLTHTSIFYLQDS